MVIIKIWGGLGNQLFQYAFGYALSKKYDEELCLDICFFKRQFSYVGRREFQLDKIVKDYTYLLQRKGIIALLEFFPINRIIHRFNTKLIIKTPWTTYIKEKKKKYFNVPAPKNNKNNYYDGYWQTSLYFKEYKTDFIKMFNQSVSLNQNSRKILELITLSKNSVSLHVRRGDFVGKNIGHLLNLDYYYKAINYIENNVDEPLFVVFSDDLTWVKDNLKINTYNNAIFVDNKCENGEIYDLFLMTKCKHGIMSASTFSWWGNWLKEDTDSIIIAPQGTYFNDCFLEENWIKV